MNHHCHAYGCKVACAPAVLMCRRHWAMVPLPLRLAVIKHYRRGQCADKRPTKDWLAAARAAINDVAKQEGRAWDGHVKNR